MKDRVFIDSNVLVYAHDLDADEKRLDRPLDVPQRRANRIGACLGRPR